jgi:hypothetical protein
MLFALVPAALGGAAAVAWLSRLAAARPLRSRPRSGWLTVPGPPRAVSADDAWVLEAFDVDEIAELVRLDEQVRSEFARDRLRVVLAKVPENRRERRVRALSWSAAATDETGRLALTLADGTSLELDGVPRSTAVWLGYCHDEFGLVLGAIRPTATSWAADLHSCGCDTPVRASRVRVA